MTLRSSGEWNESSCIRISLYENVSYIARSSRRSSVSLDKISSASISVKGYFKRVGKDKKSFF